MKIGSVTLDNITILAPLSGINNLPFRLLAKEEGCALVYSEMISSNGLVRRAKKTELLLESVPKEKPISVQIFGADPSTMAEAARIVESSGADILDINFGCSVKKIVKTGSGVALMKDPEKAEELIKAVRKSINIPFSIKIRAGWNKSGEQAFKISKIAEANGVDAIAVHPRTATQGFKGSPDWSIISKIKKMISIPVIGNGDIVTPEDAIRMIDETGCDAVMIGRSAIGNPWIFSQILSLISDHNVPLVDIALRFETMKRYLKDSIKYFGEKKACYMMRSRLGWFSKGLSHSSRFRSAIKNISSENEAMAIIKAYEDSLQNDLKILDSDIDI